MHLYGSDSKWATNLQEEKLVCRGVDNLQSACSSCLDNQRSFWCAQTVSGLDYQSVLHLMDTYHVGIRQVGLLHEVCNAVGTDCS